MKKLFVLALATVLLAFSMVVCAAATEYVYYENDFSDASTISDFTQYRGKWEIKDGALMLTGVGKTGLDSKVFLLYTKDADIMNLTDYVLEVEITPSAFAGVLARCDKTLAFAESETGFCGYQAEIDYKTTTSSGAINEIIAINRTNTAGGMLRELDAKSFGVENRGLKHFLTMTVEGQNITVVVTDENGEELYNHTTTNDEWAMGTFGFSALPEDAAASVVNVRMLKFDNLKVTAIGDVGAHLANGGKLADYKPTVKSNPVTVAKVNEADIDFTNTEYVLYENDFSDPDTIEHFTQALGNWVIEDGKLYMESVEGTFSYIVYTADETGLVGKVSDYVIEADLTGAVTMAGLVSYADVSLFSDALSNGVADGNSFYGYLSFLSNNAGSGAIGATDATGTYANVNGTVVAGPKKNGNYHLTVQHLDGKLTFTITDVDTGVDVYSKSATTDKWSNGSFGFRMRGENGQDIKDINLMTAAFDNFKVTVIGDEAALIHSGYSPDSEIVRNKTIELPTQKPEETTAATVATTAPVADNVSGGVTGIVIAIVAAAVVVLGAVVAVVVKKKGTKQ